MSDDSGIDIHIPRRLSWVTVGGFIAIIAACVAGYLNLQSTVAELSRALAELSRTVESNYNFQIEQRVRVWDRVNQLEQQQQMARETAAAVNARLTSIDTQIARILNLLEDRRP